MRGRPAPGRRPPRALALLAAGATACALLVVVTARVLTGQTGFTESDLERRIAEQRRQVEQLELAGAQLRAPQRIFQRAAELGLVPPEQVVYLTPSPAPRDPDAAGPSPSARPSPGVAEGSTPSPGRGGR